MKRKTMVSIGGKGIAFALAFNAASSFAGFSGAESVGDFVWHDLDMDGIQNNGELGLEGVLVELYSGTTSLRSMQTDSAGEYRFTDLEADGYYTYRIKFHLEDGFVFSPKDAGGDDAIDSDADQTTGFTGNFSFQWNDEYIDDVDAGMYNPVPIPGAVWLFGTALFGLGILRRKSPGQVRSGWRGPM